MNAKIINQITSEIPTVIPPQLLTQRFVLERVKEHYLQNDHSSYCRKRHGVTQAILHRYK